MAKEGIKEKEEKQNLNNDIKVVDTNIKVEEKVKEINDVKTEIKEKNNEEDKEIKKRKREEQRVNECKIKRKKIKTAIILTLTILVLLGIFSTMFSFLNLNNENIIEGVTIEGIDVSGLSKEEIKEKLNSIYDLKKQTEIISTHEDYTSNINPTALEVEYNIEETVEKAYNIGRDSNIIVNNYKILLTKFNKENIEINMK